MATTIGSYQWNLRSLIHLYGHTGQESNLRELGEWGSGGLKQIWAQFFNFFPYIIAFSGIHGWIGSLTTFLIAVEQLLLHFETFHVNSCLQEHLSMKEVMIDVIILHGYKETHSLKTAKNCIGCAHCLVHLKKSFVRSLYFDHCRALALSSPDIVYCVLRRNIYV